MHLCKPQLSLVGGTYIFRQMQIQLQISLLGHRTIIDITEQHINWRRTKTENPPPPPPPPQKKKETKNKKQQQTNKTKQKQNKTKQNKNTCAHCTGTRILHTPTHTSTCLPLQPSPPYIRSFKEQQTTEVKIEGNQITAWEHTTVSCCV